MITSHLPISLQGAPDGFLPSGGLDRAATMSPQNSSLNHMNHLNHLNHLSHLYHSSNHDLASHAHRQYNGSNVNISSPNGFPPVAAASVAAAARSPPTHTNYTYQSMLHTAVPRSSTTTHLSPTKSAAVNSPPITIPILPPDVNSAAVLYRSVSADSAALPQSGAHNHLVQRLAQQNALIREAWEAERNYLEANRRRAEEVYQEERVIMEEVREGWENEKATMLQEMQVLKERIQRLEGENHTLKAVAAQSVHISGVVSPQASLRGDSVDNASAASAPSANTSAPSAHSAGSAISGASANAAGLSAAPGFNGHLSLHGLSQPLTSSQQHALSQQLPLSQQYSLSQQQLHLSQLQQQSQQQQQHPQGHLPGEADPLTLPPGLDGASRRPHFAKPGSSRASPTGQPESSPFIPLDPRMQPQTSNVRDFLNSSSDDSDTPVPVIDVQEVDPKLEGIPLKATAVQKFTFAAKDSNNASPAFSPPTATVHGPAEKPRPSAVKRLSSKDHTFQVLRAEESRRLTMHAGHTPNHSLSLFPTMSIAASSTGAPQDDEVETSGQASTSAPDAPAEHEGEDYLAARNATLNIALGTAANAPEIAEDKTTGNADNEHVNDGPGEDHPEEILEPVDDVKLKGPLMIKNIPAQDEIFWDQVNKKLEPISQGRDALPTVVRLSIGEEEAAMGDAPGLDALRQVAPVGGDASQDPNADNSGAEAGAGGRKGIEADIPLKFKTTTNFGAPFGMT